MAAMLRATILGSAAGGGFPQWNCGCSSCVSVREGRPGYEARTQDSVALTADGERYVLLNASPDVLVQIQRTRSLWPRADRHSPIAAVLLTNGDLDHVLGLFSLRESQPLEVYATDAVWAGLEANAFLRTLRRFEGQLVRRTLRLGEEVKVAGLRARPFPLPGKLPVHLVSHAAPSAEDNVGVAVTPERGGGPSLGYATTCGSLEDTRALEGHDALLFDGTFYREDELVRLGLSKALAKDMAHVPIAGPTGSLTRLGGISREARGAREGGGKRRIYTHVNNTNPILALGSDEHGEVLSAGWEVATDGMEVFA